MHFIISANKNPIAFFLKWQNTYTVSCPIFSYLIFEVKKKDSNAVFYYKKKHNNLILSECHCILLPVMEGKPWMQGISPSAIVLLCFVFGKTKIESINNRQDDRSACQLTTWPFPWFCVLPADRANPLLWWLLVLGDAARNPVSKMWGLSVTAALIVREDRRK